jgi:hypothetical protein
MGSKNDPVNPFANGTGKNVLLGSDHHITHD